MNKNKKTALNILYQQLLVFVSFVCLFLAIYFSFLYNEWIYIFISFLISKFITGCLAIQVALHRYFSHGNFKTSLLKHKFLCYISILAGQGSPVAWAAHHRHHHLHADKELDIHSPSESKILAGGGWLLKSYEYYLTVKKLKKVPVDLLRDPTIKFIDNNYYKIWFLIILVSSAISLHFTIFYVLTPLAFGYINASFITLFSHIKLPGSYRTFNTPDNSYNNKFIQFYMLGEGLHNNHHYRPNNYHEKNLPGEFDFVGFIIKRIFIK
jgi:fatty-acid desaturase